MQVKRKQLLELKKKLKSRNMAKHSARRRIRRYKRQIQKENDQEKILLLKSKIEKIKKKYKGKAAKYKEEINALMNKETVKEITGSHFFQKCKYINEFMNDGGFTVRERMAKLGLDKKQLKKFREKWIEDLGYIFFISNRIFKKDAGLSQEQKNSKHLADTYLKALIYKQTGLAFHSIPEEMIKMKREQILLFRELKTFRKEISNGIA